MRDLFRHVLLAVALAVLAPVVAGQDRVVIGTKNFTENRLLGEIMAQLLEERTDLRVVRRINLGGTMVVASALANGAIDVYPEYTGTAWAIHLGIGARVADPLAVYRHVSKAYAAERGITWMTPFGFENSFAIAVSEARARELDLVRISDLVAHQDSLRAGVSHEFLERSDGYPGLARAYGLALADVRGMDHGLAYTAIANGEVDVVDTWTTDGKLEKYAIRILEDDRGYFPPYDCAPIVRTELLERHPEVGDVLESLGYRLPDELMMHLNYLVEVEEQSFADVARAFIESVNWNEPWWASAAAVDVDVGTSKEGQGFLAFMADRIGTTARLTAEHVLMTLTAVAAAILFAVPLGIWLSRRARAAGAVLAAAGVIQTVPSLALLAFFIPVLGLGIPTALTSLFLYALLPIVRNTFTGIREVDADVLDAARGMGLTPRQRLRIVELPLATRTIMAGVRTATVISIGVATLAAFIGAGGLGDPIVTGLQLDSTNEVLSGAVPAALLALIVDWLLGRLERRLSRKDQAVL